MVAGLREVADGFAQQVLLFEQQVIVGCHIILIVGGDTALGVAEVQV